MSNSKDQVTVNSRWSFVGSPDNPYAVRQLKYTVIFRDFNEDGEDEVIAFSDYLPEKAWSENCAGLTWASNVDDFLLNFKLIP